VGLGATVSGSVQFTVQAAQPEAMPAAPHARATSQSSMVGVTTPSPQKEGRPWVARQYGSHSRQARAPYTHCPV
jgi:hypothetical protein